ncbi:hypothetical protein FK529_06615 [Tsukamurella asaccharolytica]|uniref:Uncharacterized protein n=1 Tax=Tsukamurella asaccharolytica TaxID=2592067 RepID=A0A5C5R9P3_9ACTN|nr:hypothetical protein [Tsukamurella asaccharolytica]TWS19819.1 hypothetical protein FK529_06615 [Tsukamurella asaccharolytica]
MRLTRKPLTVVAATIAAAGAIVVAGGGPASAATTFTLVGSVTTPNFGDPMPFPKASYAGAVTAPGTIRVAPSCVQGGLAGPTAPCVASGFPLPGRVLTWQNHTTHLSGRVNGDNASVFVANTGAGQVSVQVTLPGGWGVAAGSVRV